MLFELSKNWDCGVCENVKNLIFEVGNYVFAAWLWPFMRGDVVASTEMAERTRQIEHSGTVIGVEKGVLKVEIMNSSACGACGAAQICSASEKRRKVVDVLPSDGVEYAVGDVIKFVGEESMGVKAVVIAYVIPTLLVVGGLVSAHLAGCGDGASALAGLLPLVPYYIALSLLRHKLDRSFVFRTRNL